MAFGIRARRSQDMEPDVDAVRPPEAPDLGSWDRRVLETIHALGENAHDQAILSKLQAAGHKSLKLPTLERPLRRLVARGLLQHKTVERQWQNTTRTFRFWSIRKD